jgi:aerobic carbon-monoxide dehydrogenase large subunit
MTTARFGQALPRIEDRKLLSGRGCYLDDIDLPAITHGVLVYSNHAHARIKSVDGTQALRAPGVLAVLTGKDIAAHKLGGLPPLFMPEDTGGPKGHRTMRPLLAGEIVRHVGDRVAFCVAETFTQACDAAELIKIDYEVLPSVTRLADAVAESATPVWDAASNNVCFTLQMGDPPETEKAFVGAAHRVRLRLTNNRVTASPMEPRGVQPCG